MAIRFGTSGGRAIIADEFTFANVETLTQAICEYLRASGPGNSHNPPESSDGARSVAISHLLDQVAEVRWLPVYEAPVGFKLIGELINEDKIILGGEESAGMSIKGHYPEKDGILARLPATKAIAARGASLSKQPAALFKRDGRQIKHTNRRDGVKFIFEDGSHGS